MYTNTKDTEMCLSKQSHSVRNQGGAATPRYKTKCMNVCIYLRNWNVYKHKRYRNVLS